MNRQVVLSLAIGLALAGCSSMESRRTANGDFEYTKVKQRDALQVPAGLDKPEFSNEYAIPEIGKDAPRQLVGEKLDISSPHLVLATVSGSHVEEGSRDAMVMFDKVDDSKPLDTQVWDNLLSYLEEQNIGVMSFDKDQQVLVTDWLVYQEQSSSWLSTSSVDRKVAQQFEFRLEMKPHGRSAVLTAHLRDYQETLNEQINATIEDIDTRRAEVDMLNKVLAHYENQLLIANAERAAKIREGLQSELGFDAKGQAAVLVEGDFQVTWPRLLLVLKKLGFNVTDLDQSSGLIYADFQGKERSWWDSLFGSDKGLKLEQKEYHLQVGDLGRQTSITFLNKDNQVFDAQALKDLYSPFSAVMAEDNLDL